MNASDTLVSPPAQLGTALSGTPHTSARGPLVSRHRTDGVLSAETNRASGPCDHRPPRRRGFHARRPQRFERLAIQPTPRSRESSRVRSRRAADTGPCISLRSEGFSRFADIHARWGDRSRKFERLDDGSALRVFECPDRCTDRRTFRRASEATARRTTSKREAVPARSRYLLSPNTGVASSSSCTRAGNMDRTRPLKAWNVGDHKRKFLRLRGEACGPTDPLVGVLPPLRLELASRDEWEPEPRP